MSKKPTLRNVTMVKAANDNTVSPHKDIQVSCNLPDSMGIISGETDLIAQYLAEILSKIANDNQTDE